jgi:hypothetical protein
LTNDGTNDSEDFLWVGARTPNDLAAPNLNCNDWTSADGGALLGDANTSSGRFFNANTATACSVALALCCFEP